MADKRINALTTTSASVGDDYFAIDGATNGTRALSAFSPTFGGNATVTGTLTVNGAGGSIGGQWKITNATIPDVWLQNTSGATSAYRNILIRQNSDDTFKFLSTSDAGVLSKDNILTGSNANGAIGIGVTPAAGASSLTVAGVIKTNDTTSSTSTSSGALVVSGGVGVAGAIVTGGIIRCGGSNGLSLGSDTGNIRIDSAGPAGVEFRGLSATDTITGFTMREMALIDGTTAPSTRSGYATIYVDSADGDLKVKFGDGTVKTIVTDS